MTQDGNDATKDSAAGQQVSREKSGALPWWLVCGDKNPEVTAFYMAGFGRSALFISFNFLVPAIIHFAYADAGCRQYEGLDDDALFDDGEAGQYFEKGWNKGAAASKPDECEGTVLWGLRPSSIVSVTATIGGVVVACGMPLAGSIVDATDGRHRFGQVCVWTLTLSNAAMCFITRETWFLMTLMQAVVATFSFFGLALVVYAYLPELFTDVEECVRVSKAGREYEQVGMLVLIVLTTALSLGLGLGVVPTAIVGQALAALLGGPLCVRAFQLFQPRKANRARAPNTWLVADGAMHLARVFGQLKRDYPNAAIFLVGQIFAEAATGSLTTGAILILDNVGLSAWIGVYLAVVMVFMMCGPTLYQAVARKTGSVRVSLLLSIGAFVVFFVLFVFAASTPVLAWCFAPIIGVVYGWYYPGLNSTLALLVPGGHEGELAGLNLFTAAVLSWVPPLIITVFNELNLLSVGLLSIPLFWLIGAAVLSRMDMEQAAEHVAASIKKRQRYHDQAGGGRPILSSGSTPVLEEEVEEKA